MDLSNLIKSKTSKKRRVGRGEGSGSGKTAGRGAKGQLKRGKVSIGFEGGQLPLYKRLPQRRGLGNTPLLKSITVTTGQLNLLNIKTIDEKSLRETSLIPKASRNAKIKVVADGALEKALTVHLITTKKATSIIEKAGGKVVVEEKKNSKEKSEKELGDKS